MAENNTPNKIKKFYDDFYDKIKNTSILTDSDISIIQFLISYLPSSETEEFKKLKEYFNVELHTFEHNITEDERNIILLIKNSYTGFNIKLSKIIDRINSFCENPTISGLVFTIEEYEIILTFLNNTKEHNNNIDFLKEIFNSYNIKNDDNKNTILQIYKDIQDDDDKKKFNEYMCKLSGKENPLSGEENPDLEIGGKKRTTKKQKKRTKKRY